MKSQLNGCCHFFVFLFNIFVANKSLLFPVMYPSRLAYIWAETCQLAITDDEPRLSDNLSHLFYKHLPTQLPNYVDPRIAVI